MVNMQGARFGIASLFRTLRKLHLIYHLLFALYYLGVMVGYCKNSSLIFLVSDSPMANFLIFTNQNGHNYKTQDMNDKGTFNNLLFPLMTRKPFLFVRNKLVDRIAAFTGSPHHLSNSSSGGNSAEISNATKN